METVVAASLVCITWAGLPLDRPRVMGMLNVTPDSFSDGGLHLDPVPRSGPGSQWPRPAPTSSMSAARARAPGAQPTAPAEEQARILPVIRALAAAGLRVSVDTRNAATMAPRSMPGPRIVNDVTALSHDPAAAPLVAARGCPVVLMHMRGDFATMYAQRQSTPMLPHEVRAELAARIAAAEAAGIAPQQDRHRPRHRLRQDGRAERGDAAAAGRRCAIWAARSWLGSPASRSSARWPRSRR